MKTQNKRVLCECINTKLGSIDTQGGLQYTFILELYAPVSGQHFIKFLPCNSKTKDCYTVSKDSDFAKLYRQTLGRNPVKRFSEAKHLLNHFLESRFFVDEYKTDVGKNGLHYLKATRIEAENPIKNDDWTDSGALKKRLKNRKKLAVELSNNYLTSTEKLTEKPRNNIGNVPDNKTLHHSKTLGLEPVFNPIKESLTCNKIIEPCNHVLDPNLPPDVLAFYKDRLEVLEYDFEFSKDESVELAQKAVILKYGRTVFVPVPNILAGDCS